MSSFVKIVSKSKLVKTSVERRKANPRDRQEQNQRRSGPEPRRAEGGQGRETGRQGGGDPRGAGGSSSESETETEAERREESPERRPSSDETDTDFVATLPAYSINVNDDISATANFVYNYYTTDEGVSETTSLSATDANTDQYYFVLENYEKNTFPRQVVLRFTSSIPSLQKTSDIKLKLEAVKAAMRENKVIYEDNPISPYYASVGVYDTSVDEKIYNQTTSNSVLVDNSGFLSSTKQQSLGIKFSKAKASDQSVESYRADIKAKPLFSTHSTLFISDILRTVARWQSSAFTDEYASLFEYADDKQAAARSRAFADNPLQITESECDIDLNPYDVKRAGRITSSSDIILKPIRVGVIIEKYGEQLDGSTLRYNDILVLDENPSTYVDRKIRYGGVYKYRVRTLFLKEILCDAPTGETVICKVLIASRGTYATVQCVEQDPPPPPNNISFQQTLSGLYIRWNFPINPQKDIKRFQIFRRRSIADPFELVQEINFDKSILPFTSGEDVPEALTTITEGPVKHYLDADFNKLSSDFIYSLCCIDAHGFTSNFSEQFRVRFDRINAKLLITRIATEGAPKSYPNSTVLGDFFADLVKDSGRKRIRLYFDPEYTDVTRNGNSLNFLQTTTAGLTTHKLILTELKLAQNQSVDIVVGNNLVDATGIPPAIGRFYKTT